jgi:hypothetical protein
MPVEYLNGGQWVSLPNATAVHTGANDYEVTLVQVAPSVRRLDGIRLRIDGMESVNVWGTHRSPDRIVLRVLV